MTKIVAARAARAVVAAARGVWSCGWTNETVNEINDAFTAAFPGDVVEIYSADRASQGDGYDVSEEFLNTINPPNFPAHLLRLKKSMPLMLLRNLSPTDGLCNGTRLILHEVINGRLLKCEIATKGKHCGNIVFISRMTLEADKDAYPFAWSRRQFPVRPAFAMTVSAYAFVQMHHDILPRTCMQSTCAPTIDACALPMLPGRSTRPRGRRYGASASTSPRPASRTASSTSPHRASGCRTTSASQSIATTTPVRTARATSSTARRSQTECAGCSRGKIYVCMYCTL